MALSLDSKIRDIMRSPEGKQVMEELPHYGQYTDEYGKNLKGLGQIFVEKNHNNAVGNAWVQFKRKHLRYEDIVD